ncbi:hypothetical protein JOC55_002311 [Paenibacillus sacheonensis]|nr:hypothetical protein [Paenibacillus sacheonensis]
MGASYGPFGSVTIDRQAKESCAAMARLFGCELPG